MLSLKTYLEEVWNKNMTRAEKTAENRRIRKLNSKQMNTDLTDEERKKYSQIKKQKEAEANNKKEEEKLVKRAAWEKDNPNWKEENTKRDKKAVEKIKKLGKKYKWKIKSYPLDPKDAWSIALAAHAALLVSAYKKDGWKITHQSKDKFTKKITSTYLEKSTGDFSKIKFRISNHYIEAAEWKGRNHRTLGGADAEFVVAIPDLEKGHPIKWWLSKMQDEINE